MKLFLKRICIQHTILFGIVLLCPLYAKTSALPVEQLPEDESGIAHESPCLTPSLAPTLHYLTTIQDIAHDQNSPQENIALLCNLITHDALMITPHLIHASFKEAATCIEVYKNNSNSESVEQLSAAFENHYKNLLAATHKQQLTRGKKITNLDVHGQLSAGELFVGGDAIINRNLTVNKDASIKHNLTVDNDVSIGGDLTVAGNTTHNNLSVNNLTVHNATTFGGDVSVTGNTIFTGSVIIPAPNMNGSMHLTGSPEQACIIFKNASMHEKTRICSSSVPGDKGVFVSVDGGATQNVRVNNAGGVTIAQPSSGAALAVTGNNTTTTPALKLFGNPTASAGQSVLQIDPTTGVVTQGISVSVPGALAAGTTITAGQGLTVTSGGLTVADGAEIIGSTHINTDGSSTTTIGNSNSPLTIDGATTISVPNDIPLRVTGNTTNPAVFMQGNSTTIAPALKLCGNPASYTGNLVLQIDPVTCVVTQGLISTSPSSIVSGGQAGQLIIGTTNATSTNFITNNVNRLSIDQNGNVTVPGFTTLGSLDVLGTATVNELLYQLANTISPNNILYVQKGPIIAPNQFNTINAALNSITTNSSTNLFEIRIAPGIYTEPTLTLKPYVGIIGDAQELCIIQTSAPNQNVIVGSANSYLKQVTLGGATDPGFAAILYNVTGQMHVWDCVFESNDILVNQSAAALGSFIIIIESKISATSTFTTAFKVSPAVSGMPAGMLVQALLWGPLSAKNITDFVNVSGPGAFFHGANFSVGSTSARVGATFLNASNGASVRSSTLSFAGFDTGISVPMGVAPGPSVTLWAASGINNTLDIDIQNPFTSGSIGGSFDVANGKVIINPLITNLGLFATSPAAGGVTMLGPITTGPFIANLTNISPLISYESDIGVISGGLITGLSTSFTMTVATGDGYLMIGSEPTDTLKFVQWPTQSLVLTQTNADYFIYIDSNGMVQSSLSAPSILQTIDLGKVRTGTTGILFVQDTPHGIRHLATQINETLENAFGPIYQNGSIVTQSGLLQLNVTGGKYSFGAQEFTPTGGNAITWQSFLGASTNKFIGNQTTVDYQNFDGGSGSLVPIPLGQFARHELFVINGPNETYALVYSQTIFDSLNAAVLGVNPSQPATWTENISPIASIVVTNTTVPSVAIQQILDERPRVGFSAASVAGVTDHGNLLGLGDDDHLQYLLINGTRAMSGNLNMGTNNVVNAGTMTASGTITAGGASITGATSINISGAATTMIGNNSSTTTITGATNINTTSSAITNIGNNIGPSTTTITGATTLAALTGIPLSVTGNASNPTIVSTGSSTTTAPALKLTGNPPAINTDFLLAVDGAGVVKQTTSPLNSLLFGNIVRVDKVFGNDATGQRNGSPFLTINAALAAAQSGDAAWIFPGTYNESFIIPAGVAVVGLTTGVVIVNNNVSVATDLVTMGENTRLENVALRLTSTVHVQLRGIVFPGTTSATAKLRTATVTVDNSTAGTAGTSNVYGVHSNGTGQPGEEISAIRACTITVNSTGSGVKRAILVDTANKFHARDTNFLVTTAGGAGSYIGAETNHASAALTLRTSTSVGPSADVSRTQGILTLITTDLGTGGISSANGLGFNMRIAPSVLVWADAGGLPAGTSFLRPGTEPATTNEIFLAVAFPTIVNGMSVQSRITPGTTDTFTLRKNGVDTGLIVSLTNPNTFNSNLATSVAFAAGDRISLKAVRGTAGIQDVVVTMYLY